MNNPYYPVRVHLSGGRDYEVRIGRDLIDQIHRHLMEVQITGSIIIITDNRVKLLWLNELKNALIAAGRTVHVFQVPAGEPSKSMHQLGNLLGSLAKEHMSRSSTIIALGGGVIGDLAGFVAAIYLRGIALVQIPTTLLAMVDSSVGGKTGINLPEGKNLIGAFHQPRLVLADLNTLSTLPPREFSAGMAEVLKYGAIRNASLFERVSRGVSVADPDISSIIAACVEIKARLVESDEFETKGDRALLNFGHTLGHAIERATKYEYYLHGEAIALGMRAAVRLSLLMNTGLSTREANSIIAGLKRAGLPTHIIDPISRQEILTALGNDKKIDVTGRNRWVLLKKLGEAISGIEVLPHFVDLVIEELYQAA